MKKLLLLVLTLASIFMLGACEYAPTHYVTQEEYNELEQRVLELEQMLDGLVVTTGLNGQRDYYVNSDGELYLSRIGFEMLADETEYLDKTKLPDYIFDEFGEYIDVETLDKLLLEKYFGEEVNGTFITGFQYKLSFEYDNDLMSEDELMARLSMLIIELAEYDFYTIDTSELYIHVLFNGNWVDIKVRMSLLVTDKYVLHPAIFYGEMLDTRVDGIEYDVLLVEEFYDTFMLEETFAGYILDIR